MTAALCSCKVIQREFAKQAKIKVLSLATINSEGVVCDPHF